MQSCFGSCGRVAAQLQIVTTDCLRMVASLISFDADEGVKPLTHTRLSASQVVLAIIVDAGRRCTAVSEV